MTSPSEFITERFRELLLLAGLAVAYVELTPAEYPAVPDLPAWAQLAAMGVALALVGGIFAGSRIWGLLPDPPRVYLVAIQAADAERVEVWELTPDQFEAMTVADGTLNHLSECKHPTYECVTYDPEANRARATWRESKPASELVGESDVSDALDQIAELRGAMETEARRGQAIRRRIGSVIRVLDRRRAMDQNAALEGHTAPALDGKTVDEVLRETVGDDLLPDHISSDDATGTDEPGDEPAIEFDVPAGGEALEPVDADGNGGGES